MTTDEIRLECLKLAHRPDRDPADVIERAGAYEVFVTGKSSSTLGLPKPGTPQGPADRKK